MAGSVIISPDNVWSVSSHVFHPLMDKIRSQYAQSGLAKGEIDSQFSPLDEGFEFISLEDMSAYCRFLTECKKLKQTIDDDKGMTGGVHDTLSSCLDDLLRQLAEDSRSIAEER